MLEKIKNKILGTEGTVCFPADVETECDKRQAEAELVKTLPEKVDLNVKRHEQLVKIEYEPASVLCKGCGRVHEGKSFENRSATVEAISNLETLAGDNHRRNQLVQKFKAYELDYYTYRIELEKIKQKEDAKKIFSSTFSGEAEKTCECGSTLKVEVRCAVTVETLGYAPSSDDIRKAPLPNERIISHLLMTGKVLVSPEKWSEIDKLEKEIKDLKDAKREDELEPKELALKGKLPEAGSFSKEYVLSLLEKPPELDGLIQETKDKFRAKSVPVELADDLSTALDIFKDEVNNAYSSRCATFFHAIERLAAQDAYNSGGR